VLFCHVSLYNLLYSSRKLEEEEEETEERFPKEAISKNSSSSEPEHLAKFQSAVCPRLSSSQDKPNSIHSTW
jgi:hypothetical protein